MISNMTIEIREGPGGGGVNTIKFKYDHVIALLKTLLEFPIAIGTKMKPHQGLLGPCSVTPVAF
jgi:hypothetical protein